MSATTLPDIYKCGDPDYEDLTKCGECGDTYTCDECGAPQNVEKNECQAVVDNGHHLDGTEDYA